jgi:hypothetical protein
VNLERDERNHFKSTFFGSQTNAVRRHLGGAAGHVPLFAIAHFTLVLGDFANEICVCVSFACIFGSVEFGSESLDTLTLGVAELTLLGGARRADTTAHTIHWEITSEFK